MRPLNLLTFFTSSPMSLLEQFDPCSLSSIEEDLLIKKILQTHDPDPDGRELDSSQLLLVIESTMHFISPKVIQSCVVYLLCSCIFPWFHMLIK